MKAILLRVGIDKGTGGCLAPIFENGAFEYIPIPESHTSRQKWSYIDLPGNYYRRLAPFVPRKLHNKKPHLDPEFKTFTYGDPTRKANQLRSLMPGDALIFYAGLEPFPTVKEGISRLFIIGYFIVKRVYDFKQMSKKIRGSALLHLGKNAHALRKRLDKNLIIIEGDRVRSKLLKKAIPLGEVGNRTLKDLVKKIGYERSLLRAVCHTLDGGYGKAALVYVKRGIPYLIDKGDKLFSYVVASDTGFAPNIRGGICTLACCKPKIRSVAKVGDWIVGTYPTLYDPRRITYVMRVDNSISFSEFFDDERYKQKKPHFDATGDNIYYKKGRLFYKLPSNFHSTRKSMNHDTQTDKVLVSSLFWYFGDKGPSLPGSFGEFIKKGPGHKTITDSNKVQRFVKWIANNFRVGALGNPRDSFP